MICLVCRQAETIDELTSVMFVRGEFRLVVSAVPARVCSNCKEAYVDEATVVRLLHIAEQRLEAGMLDAQCEYPTL